MIVSAQGETVVDKVVRSGNPEAVACGPRINDDKKNLGGSVV